jgi:hypothetical protein
MHLDKWVRGQPYGALSRLARATGLAYGTIFAAYKRTTKLTYQSAALIQKATRGEVTIDELCTAKPRKRAAA